MHNDVIKSLLYSGKINPVSCNVNRQYKTQKILCISFGQAKEYFIPVDIELDFEGQ